MNKIISVIIIIACCKIGIAQTFQGLILNQDSIPVEYANVMVYNSDSILLGGAHTDPQGQFHIESTVPTTPPYLYRISRIGYNPIRISSKATNIGNIYLDSDTTILKGVEITRQAPVYKVKGSSIIADISGTSLRNLDNAARILQFMPGVYTEDGEYKVFGKGTALIYLNKRLLTDMSELDRLSASDISNIEIIRNPGAEYSATSGAVLKINTIRKTDDGLSLNVTSYYQQSRKSSFQELVNLNYHYGKLDVFGSLSFINFAGWQDADIVYDLTGKDRTTITGDATVATRTRRTFGKAGFDYYFNKDNSIGATYSFTYNNVGGNSTEDVTVTSTAQNRPDHQSYSSPFTRRYPSHRGGLYYSGKVKNINIDFNNDLHYQNLHENRSTREESSITGPQLITTHNDLSNLVLVSQLKISKNVLSGNLSGGAEYGHTYRKNDFVNPESVIPSQEQKMTQNKYAAFLGYSSKFGNVEVNLGLRYELLRLIYEKTAHPDNDYAKNFSGLYPNVSVSFPIDKVNISLDYSRKTTNPSYNMIDGNVIYESRNVYKSGNPALEPAFVNDFSLTASYRGLYYSFDFMRARNSIVSTFQGYGDDIVVSTYDNYPHATMITNSLAYGKRFFRCWTPRISVDVTLSNYNLYDPSLKSNKFRTPYCSFSLSNSIEFGHGIDLFIMTDYYSKGYNYGMHVDDRTLISVILSKSWNNFSIRALFNDIFRTNSRGSTTDTSVCRYYISNYYDTQNIQITLRYNLNPKRSKYKGRSVGESEVNRL